jgi:two-component system response regulator NreC
MSIRVLIADDHGVMRAGLRALLNAAEDMRVVGEAADGREALELAGQITPDVVLLDLSMPGMSGIKVARTLKSVLPQARTLILTVHEDDELLRQAIQAGASGYIIKRAAETELITAIRAVNRGELYIHSALMRQLLQDLSAPPTPTTERLELLTPREQEVLGLLVRGYTNRQVAEKLCISTRTVEGHRANIMSKLEFRNRAEMVSFGEQCGLLG